MDYIFYAFPFFFSFFVAAIILAVIIVIAKRINFSNLRESSRHIHSKNVSRFGGTAIILSFILALLFDSRLVVNQTLWVIVICAIAILLFGFFDDLWQLDWKLQLAFQILLVFSVYFFGIRLEYISNPFGGIYSFTSGGAYFFGAILLVFLDDIFNECNELD